MQHMGHHRSRRWGDLRSGKIRLLHSLDVVEWWSSIGDSAFSELPCSSRSSSAAAEQAGKTKRHAVPRGYRSWRDDVRSESRSPLPSNIKPRKKVEVRRDQRIGLTSELLKSSLHTFHIHAMAVNSQWQDENE